MIRYAVEPLLLGFIALIFETLSLSALDLEPLARTPVAGDARKANGNAETLIKIAGGTFKVFPNKKPMASLGHLSLPRSRLSAGIRFLQGNVGAGGQGNATSNQTATGGGASDVSFPTFQTNARGEIVNHQVTFYTGPFEKLNKNPAKVYTPSLNLSTVCTNKSTIYNAVKVEKWLLRGLNSKKKRERPFLIDLRRKIFEQGESENCHTVNYTDLRKYQECAMRRNQRLEYLIPKYPQQQVVN